MISKEKLSDSNFIIRLKQTKLEQDGLIYQLLVSKTKQENDKFKENLFFTKNGEQDFNL